MNIAHINLIFSKGQMSGVNNKLVNEAQAMKDYGIETYVLNRDKNCYKDNINYIKIDNLIYNKLFPELYLRSFRYKIISSLVDLDKYDFIILRYPLIDPSAFKFSKKYKYKIITEHHTKELNEIKISKIKEPFRTIQYLFEKHGSKYFFRNIYGAIGVSLDIVNTIKGRIDNKNIKSHVFSNGVYLENYKKRKIPELTNVFNLVFVASIFNKWHGLDRLLRSCFSYQGDKKICLHIVGTIAKEDKLILKNNNRNDKFEVVLHDNKTQEELIKLYESMHMACDSLAMYRLNMNESSTLKSKEYILNNLPFIFSAPDFDLARIQNYLYRCENSDKNINMNEIIEHYRSINKINMVKDFEDCVNKTLSWNVKVKDLYKWVTD